MHKLMCASYSAVNMLTVEFIRTVSHFSSFRFLEKRCVRTHAANMFLLHWRKSGMGYDIISSGLPSLLVVRYFDWTFWFRNYFSSGILNSFSPSSLSSCSDDDSEDDSSCDNFKIGDFQNHMETMTVDLLWTLCPLLDDSRVRWW